MESSSAKLNLEEHFQHVLKKYNLKEGDKVIVGVSGGLDSTTLLQLAFHCKLDVIACHVNYGLRGEESQRDRNHVVQVCKTLDIILEELDASDEMNVKDKRSTQMKARDLRRAFFTEMMQKHQAKFILLGHHADDQLETFFIQFFRNQGLFSLAGMDELQGFWLRPFIYIRRALIEEYAVSKGFSWVEDSSNKKEDYLRNQIRHRILPEIENLDRENKHKAFESVERLNSDRSALIQLFSKIEDEQVEAIESGFRIKKELAREFQSPESFLSFLLRKIDVSYAFIKEIAGNLTSTEQKQFLSAEVKVVIDRTHLTVYKDISNISPSINEGHPFIEIDNIPENELKTLNFNRFEAIINPEKILGKLHLRKWQNGDRFWPSGMKGSKLLSDYFTNEKFNQQEKDEQWLLCHENDIVWLVNQRIDARFMYQPGDEKAVRIRITPS
ncbi:MAG: tRNA lysidine(34) synthetase TilS [Bacteroidia bacterium]